MLNVEYRTKLSQFLTNPSRFRPFLREVLESSKPIVVKQEQREMPILSGMAKSGVKASPLSTNAGGDFYVVNTTAQNNGFFYPLAVARGTLRFRGSRQDSPSFGRVKSGESKRNRGIGGIQPNMFDIRAKIGARPLLIRHFIGEIRKGMEKMIESNNG